MHAQFGWSHSLLINAQHPAAVRSTVRWVLMLDPNDDKALFTRRAFTVRAS